MLPVGGGGGIDARIKLWANQYSFAVGLEYNKKIDEGKSCCFFLFIANPWSINFQIEKKWIFHENGWNGSPVNIMIYIQK